jgi:outer membrane immunogenic protein
MCEEFIFLIGVIMSKKLLSCVLAVAVSSAAGSTLAQESLGLYAGLGYGIVKLSDAEGFSNPKNGSLTLGYSFTENWAIEGQFSSSLTEGTFSESDTMDTTADTRRGFMSQGFTAIQAAAAIKTATTTVETRTDLSVDAPGIFGVYRTSGDLYAKVKMGAVSLKTTAAFSTVAASAVIVDSSNKSTVVTLPASSLSEFNESTSETSTEFSVGVGAGYKFAKKFAVELEYVRFSDEVDVYSLGVNYAF